MEKRHTEVVKSRFVKLMISILTRLNHNKTRIRRERWKDNEGREIMKVEFLEEVVLFYSIKVRKKRVNFGGEEKD